MHGLHPKCVLASRSPRRLELLRQILPDAYIEVVPPRSAEEAGFAGLDAWPALERRLVEIARAKCEDVLAQIQTRQTDANRPLVSAVVAADTIIVATSTNGRLVVLGQPPDDECIWADKVRMWFREYYAGRTHTAMTGLCLMVPDGRSGETIVKSQVSIAADAERWLEWYITTGEPRGKAGGYALQGAGSLFVTGVEGSLSNVVGLPLRELWELFEELGIEVHCRPSS